MAKIQSGKNATKKEVIIQKAAFLFKTKGYSATSMRELADALGVEAPSLYNYIGSKSELIQAICIKVMDEFTINLDAVENNTETATAKIEAIVRFHIQKMLNSFDEVFVANHEWKHLKEPLLSTFLNQRRSYEKRLMILIENGIEKNELRAINPYVAVLTILSAVRGLEFWHGHKKNVTQQELENDMVNHLLNGIIK
jgi:TetR/AcrR family transcriptional regulator, cholesterol catabolism regulator